MLIAFTAMYVCLLPPASVMALMSPMMSDSGLHAGVWTLMAGCVLAPVALIASLVAAWIGFCRARYRLAVWALVAPLIFAAAIVVVALCIGDWQ